MSLNRHQRRHVESLKRKHRAAAPPSLDPSLRLALHQIPESMPAPHRSVLVNALTMAGLSASVPGVVFPLHVTVEMAGQTFCGEVFPAADGYRSTFHTAPDAEKEKPPT